MHAILLFFSRSGNMLIPLALAVLLQGMALSMSILLYSFQQPSDGKRELMHMSSPEVNGLKQ